MIRQLNESDYTTWLVVGQKYRGRRAGRIYLNNGFIDLNSTGKNPAGIDAVKMGRKIAG